MPAWSAVRTGVVQRPKDKILSMDPKEITYEMVQKKLQEIAMARGKTTRIDRQEQVSCSCSLSVCISQGVVCVLFAPCTLAAESCKPLWRLAVWTVYGQRASLRSQYLVQQWQLVGAAFAGV